jgi:hypothetical protein
MTPQPEGHTELPGGQPALMTDDEVIAYLRLDVGSANPRERLRNLIRRSHLPVQRRGGLRLFRRSDIDAWLAGEKPGKRIRSPARLQAPQ